MRLIVKVGTQVISGKAGLNKRRIGQIIKEIAELFKLGHEVVLVSSGAIGAGLSHVSFEGSARKKVAAAIGQPLLIQAYINSAKKYKLSIGQVLILGDDFSNKKHFKNFALNLNAMLSHKILPIINENDVMKREDLRVNDNDMLSAMVATGLRAKKLIILTNQEGFYTRNPDKHRDAKLIKKVPHLTDEIKSLCNKGKSRLGVGGMFAKIKATEYATARGVETFIGSGEKKGTILGALGADFTGTRFASHKIK
ncbi:MAG: glutamate 5-kinase [Candidatus Paceibacterota bacterium]|jgi:glutamate 5-kinase